MSNKHSNSLKGKDRKFDKNNSHTCTATYKHMSFPAKIGLFRIWQVRLIFLNIVRKLLLIYSCSLL